MTQLATVAQPLRGFNWVGKALSPQRSAMRDTRRPTEALSHRAQRSENRKGKIENKGWGRAAESRRLRADSCFRGGKGSRAPEGAWGGVAESQRRGPWFVARGPRPVACGRRPRKANPEASGENRKSPRGLTADGRSFQPLRETAFSERGFHRRDAEAAEPCSVARGKEADEDKQIPRQARDDRHFSPSSAGGAV